MRIAVRDHQNKSAGLVKAIRSHGRHEVYDVGTRDDMPYADILLIDHDATSYYKYIIERYKASGAKIVLYPHGATAHLAWDGVWPADSRVDAYLAQSSGQAEVMRIYGYPHPIHVTGWHWCRQKKFKETIPEVPTVLFAPIHPQNSGFIYSKVKDLTWKVLDKLYTLDYDIIVRYLGSLEDNRLDDYRGIDFVQGFADNSIEDIDSVDLVVSFGTFSYLAIARGVPTIMYRQNIPYFDGHSEDSIRYATNFDKYGEFIRYPFDIDDDSPSYDEILKSDKAIRQWKDDFIGDMIDPERLNEILEEILHA